MDAWKNGGMFEGQKATDALVIAHWQQRLAGISKDDPLYDVYANAVLQTEYAIAESKMTVQYGQGHISDTQAAQFYLSWAKRIPADSEFYRVLQRDAAQYMRAARAKASAGAAQAEATKFANSMNAIEQKYESAGQLALQAITKLAQAHGVLAPTDVTDPRVYSNSPGAGGINLGQLQMPGVDTLMSLLASVSPPPMGGEGQHPGAQGSPAVLYRDYAGNPVTGASLIAQFKALDPTFNGDFNLAYVQGALNETITGLEQRIALATKTGHVSIAMALKGQLAQTVDYANETQALPVVAAYSKLEAQLQADLADPNLLPAAKVAAIERDRAAIGKLANDPRIPTGDRMQNQLLGEAHGIAGTVTVADDLTGQGQGYTNAQNVAGPNGPRDTVGDANAILASQQGQVAVTADPANGWIMTKGSYVADATGVLRFQPSPVGLSYGAAPTTDVQNLAGGAPYVSVMLPNGDGGGMTLAAMVPGPVTATANRADGRQMAQVDVLPVTTFIKYRVNGIDITLYSIRDATTGAVRWTADPPWADKGIPLSDTNAGIALDLTNVATGVAATADLTKNGPVGNTGFEVRGYAPPTSTNLTGTPGVLVFTPSAATFASDQTRQTSGYDPNTDSFSPTLVALRQLPDGQALITKYAQDPTFRELVFNDAAMSAGMTLDRTTGQWSGSAAQQAAYNTYHYMGVDALSTIDTGTGAGERNAWNRDTTNLYPVGGGPASVPGLLPGGLRPGTTGAALPLDQVRQMPPDDRFAGLTTVTLPGTNKLAPPPPTDTGLAIRLGQGLTVPSNPFTGPTGTGPINLPTSGYQLPTSGGGYQLPTSTQPTTQQKTYQLPIGKGPGVT